MANLTLYRSFDSSSFGNFETEDEIAPKVTKNSFSFKKTANGTLYEGLFKGSFQLNSKGEITGGTVRQYDYLENNQKVFSYDKVNTSIVSISDLAYGKNFSELGRNIQFASLVLRNSDTVIGSSGSDTIGAFAGNDKMYGRGGNDRLFGGHGKDQIDGGAGSDFLYGDDGNDTLNGGAGGDRLFGHWGNDTLNGGAGNDRVYGALGNDTLNGGIGNDRLIGGEGNDLLSGESGADILKGGSGKDGFYYRSVSDSVKNAKDVILDFSSQDTLYISQSIATTASGLKISDSGSKAVITDKNSAFTLTVNGDFSASDIQFF